MEPVTLVTGFGRCGSSLVMQMLAAGGMRMTGRFPAFEDDRLRPLYGEHNNAAWLADCGGSAVKLLDPQLFDIPSVPSYRVIWCSRDYEEQARSQVKFARLMLGLPTNRRAIKAFAKSYADDKPHAVKSLTSARCGPILDIRFESTLSRPWDIAEQIAAHCSHIKLDIERMASAVRPRHPSCAPGLDMEITLVNEARS